MTVCKGCGAEIIFVKMAITGKSLPVDAQPNDEGIVFAGRRSGGWEGYVIKRGALITALSGFNRYMPHYATCPQADQFRKPKTQRSK